MFSDAFFPSISELSRGSLPLQEHKGILPGREITFLFIITNKQKHLFVVKKNLNPNPNQLVFQLFEMFKIDQNFSYPFWWYFHKIKTTISSV